MQNIIEASLDVVTIREPIERTWTDEVIYLACPPDRVAARDAETGEWLPSQVVCEDDTRRLAVRLSLMPGQERQIACVADSSAAAPSSFSITETDHSGLPCYMMANSRLVVMVPRSQAFNADQAPGPLLAMRRNNDTVWTGQGEWGLSAGCGRIETEILAVGPLFLRWQTCYLVGGKEYACYEMTLLDGEDFIQVRERSMLDGGAAFRFVLERADAPQCWCTHGGGEQAAVLRGPVTSPPPRLGLERPGEFVHIDFHSGHQQSSYSWFGVWREEGPLIGVAELHGGQWCFPGRNRITMYRTETGLAWHFPANGGSREYALSCGMPDAYAPATGLSRFCHLRRKYSDLPLEKVRHWHLDWALPKRSVSLLYPDGTAECWRAKAVAWPELAGAYERLAAEPTETLATGALLPAYLITGEPRLRTQFLEYSERWLDASLDHALDNGYIRLIIFTGRGMKATLDGIDILRTLGDLDEETERKLARKLAFLAYCFADPDYWPWDSVFRPQSDPRSHGGDYWDDAGSSICPPNFTTEYYSSTGIFALAYPEHPASAGWIAWTEELFARNLDAMFFEGGGYEESANYHNHTLGMLTQLAVGLLAGGHRDFFAHPRFKANYGFFVENLTPRVALVESSQQTFSTLYHLNPPTDGTAAFITSWGNSGHDCGGTNVPPALAVAAGIYADRDPAYARRLMTAWRRSPQQFCSAYWGFDLLVLGRPDLPEIDLALDSRLVEGTGAVMRAAQGTPEEIFAWIKCGPATHHNCNDEGGLVLYGHGAPLLGDFGYHTQHQGCHNNGYETWKHTCVSFGGKTTSFYLGIEQALPPQFWQSTPEADLLVCDLSTEYLLPEGAPYCQPIRIPHIDHTRSILFVKPRYFVIYDQIAHNTLPATWWLHALADRIEVDGNHAICYGQFSINLDVQLLLPNPACIATGEYSVQRHLRVEQATGNYLAVITPLRPHESAPVVQFDLTDGLLTVSGTWGIDRIRTGGQLPLQLLP